MGNQFLVLARPTPNDNVVYLLTEVEVSARNWADAYNQVRAMEFTPLVDELGVTPITNP